MKAKSLLFLGIFLLTGLFFPSQSNAQNKENVVTLSITNLVLVTPTGYYERVLGDNTSAKIGLYYTMFKITDTKMSGLGIIPEFRFYPGDNGAPKGFYLAPFMKYQNYSLSQDDEMLNIEYKATLSAIGGGLCIGGQFGDNFIVDIFIGPGFSSWTWSYEGNSEQYFDNFKLGGSGVGLRFGVSLGFGF